jgi:small subunit ribosomal protein S6
LRLKEFKRRKDQREVNEMNSYETLYIIKPDMEDENRSELIERFSALVKDNGGEVENIDEWGKRKLAYEINYIGEGYYVLMNFKANPDLPLEMERLFEISEYIIRYIVIRKDKN